MTAAARAAALLRQFDQSLQHDEGARVNCTEPGCRSELICRPTHVDNLTATWRCLEHRETPKHRRPQGDNPMSPRRNTKAYNRRRGSRPLQTDTEVAVSWEALAAELVRRGKATKAILDRPTTPNDPHERNQQ
jgi:hypothetical protein